MGAHLFELRSEDWANVGYIMKTKLESDKYVWIVIPTVVVVINSGINSLRFAWIHWVFTLDFEP